MSKRSRHKIAAVISRTPEQVQVEINTMPHFEVDRMCSTIIGCVNRFFENPDVQADFERWKQSREAAKI